jgi:hypothetical protein
LAARRNEEKQKRAVFDFFFGIQGPAVVIQLEVVGVKASDGWINRCMESDKAPVVLSTMYKSSLGIR